MTHRLPIAHRGFTLIELLVVVSLIVLLIAILQPSFAASKERARQTICLANLYQVGIATRQYGDDFVDQYPYGVPVPILTVDHPHYTTWRGGGVRGGGVPPQQQFHKLGYITDHRIYICPTDPHPANYVWWDYDVHPDITTGSSYMFSEYALFGVAWQKRQKLTHAKVWQPAGFAWATDGWMCPNGWTWGTADLNDPAWIPPMTARIDWSHNANISVLYGDGHVAIKPQEGAREKIRTHPQENF